MGNITPIERNDLKLYIDFQGSVQCSNIVAAEATSGWYCMYVPTLLLYLASFYVNDYVSIT